MKDYKRDGYDSKWMQNPFFISNVFSKEYYTNKSFAAYNLLDKCTLPSPQCGQWIQGYVCKYQANY